MLQVYPFALAQALVELPYVGVQTILYSLITYFMTYFYIDAGDTSCWFLQLHLHQSHQRRANNKMHDQVAL